MPSNLYRWQRQNHWLKFVIEQNYYVNLNQTHTATRRENQKMSQEKQNNVAPRRQNHRKIQK